MSFELLEKPARHGYFSLIGHYNGCPIYVGPTPSKDWVAKPTDDNNGVCINREAYDALRRSEKFIPYTERICEFCADGQVDGQPDARTAVDRQILQYLQQEGILPGF